MKDMKKLILSVFALSAMMLSACSGGSKGKSSSSDPSSESSQSSEPSSESSQSSSESSQESSSQSSESSSESSESSSSAEEVSVVLDEGSLFLDAGESGELIATVYGSEEDPVWTSDDEDVATVDQYGIVTAVAEGVAVITATVGDAYDTCTVTVTETTPAIASVYRLVYGTPGSDDATWGYGSGVQGTKMAGDESILDQAKYVVELTSEAQGFKFVDGEGNYVGASVAENPYYDPEDGDIMPGKAGTFEVYLKRYADSFSIGIVRVNPNAELKEFAIRLNAEPTADRTLLAHGWGKQGEEDVEITEIVGANVNIEFTKQINGFLIAELKAGETTLGKDWVNVERQTENFEAADYDPNGINQLSWKGTGGGDLPVNEGYFLVGSFTEWQFLNSNKLTKVSDSKYTIEGVQLAANDKLKVSTGDAWFGNRDTWTDCGFTLDKEGNVVVSAAGEYTIDFYPTADNGNYIVPTLDGETPEEPPVGPEDPVADGYYLAGSFSDWEAKAAYKLTVDAVDANKYSISDVTFAAEEKLKVRTEANEWISNAETWKNCGFTLDEEGNVVVTEAGTYDVDFYVVGDNNNHIVLNKHGVAPVDPETVIIAVTLDDSLLEEFEGRTFFLHSWGDEGVWTAFFQDSGNAKIIKDADGFLFGILDEGKDKDDGLGGSGWPNVDARTADQTTIPATSLGVEFDSGIVLSIDGAQPVAPVTDEIDLYFSNNYKWSHVYAYVWKDGGTAQKAWPGTELVKSHVNPEGEDVYKVTVDLEAYDHIIFTSGAGEQTVDIDVSKKSTNDGFYISGGESSGYTVGTWVYVPGEN